MPRAIVIDTDPGLDDAVAILFALARPDAFDLRGISTVAGNIGLATTTRNAGRLLALAGRGEVPVVAGAAGPLLRPGIDETRIHGADGLGGVAFPEPLRPAGEGAAGWLAARLMEAEAGTLDLLALGPLTNLATLIAEAPEAARRLGRVIAMGGAVREPGNVGPRAEFNMAADPEAAAAVFGFGLNLTLVPLDVTRKVRAGRADLARLAAGGPSARACGALIAAYFEGTRAVSQVAESRPLHDPCVMLLAAHPELFGCERLRLGVDCGAEPGALGPGEAELSVALRVDGAAALEVLLAGLEGA